MKLTKAQIEHVADLSRLALSTEEGDHLSEELTAIIGHVEKLNELDTTKVKPTYHVNALTNVFRDDVVKKSLETKELLQGAPAHDDHSFHVPKIIELDV